MTITVGGTAITFNDGTTQSTAAGASTYVGGRGQAFTTSGTFTIPAGVTAVKVTVVGGGGGSTGGACTNTVGGAGGGAAIKFFTGLTPGNTLAVTVGAGGPVSGAGGTSSVASGTQTITTVSATGGAGGINVPVNGGIGSNGDLNIRGSSNSSTTGSAGKGGNSILGGGTAGRGVGGAYGGGAGSDASGSSTGGAGVVVFEW